MIVRFVCGRCEVQRFLGEFKEFINKGNLLAVAIGFVMGAAFTAVVNALVDNVIMPIVAIPFGKPNFDAALVLTINDAQIRFGAFVTQAVGFLLVAFTLFVLVKAYNRATSVLVRANGEPPTPEAETPPPDVVLLSELVAELRALRADMNQEPPR
jgi:large conductance mechanosensitive channel